LRGRECCERSVVSSRLQHIGLFHDWLVDRAGGLSRAKQCVARSLIGEASKTADSRCEMVVSELTPLGEAPQVPCGSGADSHEAHTKRAANMRSSRLASLTASALFQAPFVTAAGAERPPPAIATEDTKVDSLVARVQARTTLLSLPEFRSQFYEVSGSSTAVFGGVPRQRGEAGPKRGRDGDDHEAIQQLAH